MNTLTDILAPRSPAEFLATVRGRRCWHVPGTPGRFGDLLDWPSVNAILEQHRLVAGRLRVIRNEEDVPASRLFRNHVALPGVRIPRLDVAELNEQLWRGATLVIEAIDEMHAPIAGLTHNLEAALHESIQVNAYIGWPAATGYGLHWDDHDVIVLQVCGRKRWSIYPSTTSYPLSDEGPDVSRPSGAPAWDGVVEDGDLVYVPRGWWHGATALEEPTVHLTFGMANRTGIDFLRWLRDRLRAVEAYRMDLPRFADRQEQAAHMDRLRHELLAAWTPDTLDRFFAECDAAAVPRPRLSLPWSAMLGALPGSDARIKLVGSRGLALRRTADEGDVEFDANGRRWRFPGHMEPMLRLLDQRRLCSIAEIDACLPIEADRVAARGLLRVMLLQGLVVLDHAPSTTHPGAA